MRKLPSEIVTRFWSRVDKTSSCWNWLGRLSDGYGRFWINREPFRAHRVAYLLEIGEIPEGLQLDHLCRNRSCVNPAHLEVVDSRTNALRGIGPAAQNARKTHCAHGHPLSGTNLRVHRAVSRGIAYQARVCRNCRIDRQRRSRRKLRTLKGLERADGKTNSR